MVPNSFCALPIVTVALTRRCVTSTVALTFCFANAFLTALRLFLDAPYLLWKVDSDGYLPYEDDDGLLAALTASAMFDWLTLRPTCRPSFRLVEAAPALLRPLWEIGP